MKSAEKIRDFSRFVMLVNIVGFSLYAIIMLVRESNSSYETKGVGIAGFVIAFIGIVGSVFLNYLFLGFADLIDNTYIMAGGKINNGKEKEDTKIEVIQRLNGTCDVCGLGGIEVSSISIKSQNGTKFKKICDKCLDQRRGI